MIVSKREIERIREREEGKREEKKRDKENHNERTPGRGSERKRRTDVYFRWLESHFNNLVFGEACAMELAPARPPARPLACLLAADTKCL